VSVDARTDGTQSTILRRSARGACTLVSAPLENDPALTAWSVVGGSDVTVRLVPGEHAGARLAVYDIAGRVVARRVVSAGDGVLRVGGLGAGVYFVTLDGARNRSAGGPWCSADGRGRTSVRAP